MTNIEEWKRKVLSGGSLTEKEALALAAHPDRAALCEAAHEITRCRMGDRFDTCSIINAKSGNCPEDCRWCAQSVHYPTAAERYPLLPAEACVEQARRNEQQGVRRFALVTSGKRLNAPDLARISETVRRIRRETRVRCCASLGLLDTDALRRLRASGVENYHCNIETAPSFFPRLCTTHTIAQKVETLRAARSLGFRLCSGGIIGMGETMEQRVEMALFLRKEGIRSIPLNLLQPIPGTPLAGTAPLAADELLATIALFRWINPDAYLRFAGGRRQLPEAVQRQALYVGINAAITGDLLTTAGCGTDSDRALFRSAGYSLERETDWVETAGGMPSTL